MQARCVCLCSALLLLLCRHITPPTAGLEYITQRSRLFVFSVVPISSRSQLNVWPWSQSRLKCYLELPALLQKVSAPIQRRPSCLQLLNKGVSSLSCFDGWKHVRVKKLVLYKEKNFSHSKKKPTIFFSHNSIWLHQRRCNILYASLRMKPVSLNIYSSPNIWSQTHAGLSQRGLCCTAHWHLWQQNQHLNSQKERERKKKVSILK